MPNELHKIAAAAPPGADLVEREAGVDYVKIGSVLALLQTAGFADKPIFAAVKELHRVGSAAPAAPEPAEPEPAEPEPAEPEHEAALDESDMAAPPAAEKLPPCPKCGAKVRRRDNMVPDQLRGSIYCPPPCEYGMVQHLRDGPWAGIVTLADHLASASPPPAEKAGPEGGVTNLDDEPEHSDLYIRVMSLVTLLEIKGVLTLGEYGRTKAQFTGVFDQKRAEQK